MPTITLNKTVFETLVGKTLPLEELKDRISMLGTDLEKIEGNEIHVEIFPNRPDMLSEQGFARAFSSFIGVKTGLRKYPVQESGKKVVIDDSVKEVRPYTACAIVHNVPLDTEKIREIIQIQEKLHGTYGRNRKKAAIGIYPMEKITFPITYTAEIPEKIKFHPLEGAGEMTAPQIVKEHKAGKEYGHLLEGKEKYPLFVDAAGNILSMPPIINSHLTGKVTEETNDVFIECSGFNFRVLCICLNIIVTALADMGGEIRTVELVYGKKKERTPDLTPTMMKLDLAYVNKRLGLSLQEKEAAALLERMGYGYKKGQVLIPAYRADILHQADIVEDIAIAYGYENFKEEIPNVSTIAQEDNFEKFARKVREVMVGMGLLEVKNYHLMSVESLAQKMNLPPGAIPLKNALGEHNHLRNALLPGVLKTLAENQHAEYPQNIFEIGRVFEVGKSETGIVERERLAVAACHDKADFTEIRQIADALCRELGLKCIVKEAKHPSYIPGRVGDLFIGKDTVGMIGEIHPSVLGAWGLAVPVAVMEVELGLLR